MANKKLLPLESLRGIAAISVAFFHFDSGSHFNNQFIHNSWIMVDFFFIISGFVISLNYIDRIKCSRDLFSFQKKRFLRLYPLHFVMLIFFLFIECLKWLYQLKTGVVSNNPPFSINDFEAFVANIFLLQNWVISDLTYNYPSWSISSEFFIYVLFAAMIIFTGGKRGVVFVTSALSILVFGYFLNQYGMGTDNVSGPLRCAYSFAIGIIVFYMYERLSSKVNIKSSIPLILSMIASVVFVIYYADVHFVNFVLLPLTFAITIFISVTTDEKALVNHVLKSRALVYLGTISYGIYMIHAAVWWIIVQFLRFVLKVDTKLSADGKTVISIDNVFVADLISILGIVSIFILAHISHKYFEKRFTAPAKK